MSARQTKTKQNSNSTFCITFLFFCITFLLHNLPSLLRRLRQVYVSIRSRTRRVVGSNPIWGSDFFCVLLWLILYISLYFLCNINISGIGSLNSCHVLREYKHVTVITLVGKFYLLFTPWTLLGRPGRSPIGRSPITRVFNREEKWDVMLPW